MDSDTLSIFRILSSVHDADESTNLILVAFFNNIGVRSLGYYHYNISKYLQTMPRTDGVGIEDASYGVREIIFGKES